MRRRNVRQDDRLGRMRMCRWITGGTTGLIASVGVFGMLLTPLQAGTLKEDCLCTQVIGFSQTENWYNTGEFEAELGTDRVERLTRGGAVIQFWADPDFLGWDEPVYSPCAESSGNPQRVILTVSGPFLEDVDEWVKQTTAAIETLRGKYPELRQIILQSVVGGPDHQICPAPGDGDEIVRDSYQHPFVDEALAQVVQADPTGDVVFGFSPEVHTCDGFRDQKGHLSSGRLVATDLGRFYAKWFDDTTPPTEPGDLAVQAVSSSATRLSWVPAEDPESTVTAYRVYRDGEMIGLARREEYEDAGLTPGSTHTYEVAAVNGMELEGPKAGPIDSTTEPDSDPPWISDVQAAGNPEQITLRFSEPLDPASAESASQYSLDQGINVLGASLEADERTVLLQVSPMSDGTTYTLTVTQIEDQQGNPVNGDTLVTFEFQADLAITQTAPSEYQWASLRAGRQVYVDRAYEFNDVPDEYVGWDYLRTANDDKDFTGDGAISFEVNQNVTVYVAHDDRIASKPEWLTAFSDTGRDLIISELPFSLWAREFEAGTVELGGNIGDQAAGSVSMYSVVVNARNASPPPPDTDDGGDFPCTQVIGFSQTENWFNTGEFEAEVGNDRVERLTRGGAEINLWARPDYPGWSDPIFSPCVESSGNPQRVILTVSGSYGDDVEEWMNQTAAAIETIRGKYPELRQIILQPVVGGPDHQLCPDPDGGSEMVRASFQHPYIDEALAGVAKADTTGEIVLGFSPEVHSCDGFRDQKGHLSSGRLVATDLGRFYAQWFDDTTPPSAPAGLTVRSVSPSVVRLNWEPATDPESTVTAYRVYRNGEWIGLARGHEFEDTGLAPNTTHAYEVTAVNGMELEGPKAGPVESTTDPDPDSSKADQDGDGLSDEEEEVAGTDPADPRSRLAIESLVRHGDGRITIRWQSVPQRSYQIQFRTLSGDTAWETLGQAMQADSNASSWTGPIEVQSAGLIRVLVQGD